VALLLELCAAAAKVPGISLALLAGELGIARQTLHERLTGLQREGPLNPPPRWHELTTDRHVRAP
jgi:DNA-binding IclR family transcriptional regulator